LTAGCRTPTIRAAERGGYLSQVTAPRTLDCAPSPGTLRAELLEGLRSRPRAIPSKLLYDARGSELFERICLTPEYYLTRAELEIMQRFAAEMAELCGPGCALIEYGSGSASKTRPLLEQLREPAAYVPIDISRDALEASARSLALALPGLCLHPVCADYTVEVSLPEIPARRRVVLFPGSTIGNLEPPEARKLLENLRRVCGSGGAALIGVDLHKSAALLEPAYDDAAGITAAFELNVLARLNREFEADFEPQNFAYRSRYNVPAHRVEMYLESLVAQRVRVAGESIALEAGEHVRTEYSYKYELGEFADLARSAGLVASHAWLDSRDLFSVHYLEIP
jgi:dimethylhistidine N-methyltransferase